MNFLGQVLGLWVAGEAVQAARLVATVTVTPDVVDELGQAAAFVEDPVLAGRLRDLSDQLQSALQTQDKSATAHLKTSLAGLFREMDDDVRRRLASLLSGSAGAESVEQTLSEMMRKGKWLELGTLLSQQSEEAMGEVPLLRARFALSLEQADLKTARTLAEEMIHADPKNSRGYLGRVELALADGQSENAQRMFDEAARFAEPEFARDHSLYEYFCSVLVRIHLAKKHFGRANGQMQEWFANGSAATLAERCYLRGLIKEREPGTEAHSMTIWMEKAFALAPQRADYAVALARAYLRESKMEAAGEMLRKSLTLNPINPAIWREIPFLYLQMRDWKSALSVCRQDVERLKPRVGSFVPAGLGLIIAFAYDDMEEAAFFEVLLREIALEQNSQTKDWPMVVSLAFQNFYRTEKERTRGNILENFPREVLRFGAAVLAASVFIDPFFTGEAEEKECFFELGWKAGTKLFGDGTFDKVIEFFWSVKGLPSEVVNYIKNGAQPILWSEAGEGNVLAAISLAFRERNYFRAVELSREILTRFGLEPRMRPASRAQLERWFVLSLFYWAFEGTGIKERDLKDILSTYRSWTTGQERWNHVQILARQYDAAGFPWVGDRLLTLSEDSRWTHALARRYLERLGSGGKFDDFILGLSPFRAALLRIQGRIYS